MSEQTITIDVGADIGNATSIVAVRPAGAKSATVKKFPTAVAYDFAAPTKLTADDHVFYRKRGEKLVASLAVGVAALRYADGEVITARGSRDRYGSFLADFVDAGIAAQVKHAHVIVRQLNVTVPAKHYDAVKADVIKALKGKRERIYRERSITIDVQAVKVWREAEAALATVKDKAKGATILIDGGGGQTHVAIARDGVLSRDPVTRETGLQRAIDRADDGIEAEHGRRLTPLERYEVERHIATKPATERYEIIVNGKGVRVDSAVRDELADVAPYIINDIQALVPKWRNASTILLGGGQALHLAAQYKAAFDGIVIVQRPDEWNALGALVLGGGAAVEVEEVA